MVQLAARRTVLRSARNPLRVVGALWLLVGIIVSIRILFWPSVHTVFPIFAASSWHWWSDQSLYACYPPLDRFRYPPVFAVAVSPCAFLGLRAGGLVWFWLSLGVYALGLWRLAFDVLPGTWTRKRLSVYLGLGLLGALCGLWNSQSNALAVGLLLLGTTALMWERWWLSATLLAASVLLKVTPLAPVLLLCALWPRPLTLRFLAVLVAGLLLPFLTKPPDTVLEHYVEWIMHISESAGARWPGFRDGWTAWAVVRDFLQGGIAQAPWMAPMDSTAYRALQCLSALAALAWCLWQRARGTAPHGLAHATLGIGLSWLILFGPAVEHQTYVFLAPPLAWAMVERWTWPRGRWLLTAAFVLIIILGWDAITTVLRTYQPLVMATLPAGTALFAVWWIGYSGVDNSRNPVMNIRWSVPSGGSSRENSSRRHRVRRSRDRHLLGGKRQ